MSLDNMKGPVKYSMRWRARDACCTLRFIVRLQPLRLLGWCLLALGMVEAIWSLADENPVLQWLAAGSTAVAVILLQWNDVRQRRQARRRAGHDDSD